MKTASLIPNLDMMHASDWTDDVDPSGWIITEKHDGFFARWTGETLLTRDGLDYHAPDWFTRFLPNARLDCEVFAGRGNRNALNNCHQWRDKSRWQHVRLIIFDAPDVPGSYIERHAAFANIRPSAGAHSLQAVSAFRCKSAEHLLRRLTDVTLGGGEGLIIRHWDAPYTVGRVHHMLKVK